MRRFRASENPGVSWGLDSTTRRCPHSSIRTAFRSEAGVRCSTRQHDRRRLQADEKVVESQIAPYAIAYRMQMSLPDVMVIAGERTTSSTKAKTAAIQVFAQPTLARAAAR